MNSEAKLFKILSTILELPEDFILEADSVDIVNKKINFSYDNYLLNELATATPMTWEDPLMDNDFYRWKYRGWEVIMDKEGK
jgi:hypothetical protein